MSKLDDAISNTSYVLDCLMVLRNILKMGDCNNCKIKDDCQYVPRVGATVRYNCPFYVKL